MVQSSFALMTNLGRAKEAAALANGTTIEVTHIAIGDGATVPSGGETALYNEVARKTISGHGTVSGASNVAYFDAFLAADDGPYTIRESGLYDSAGDLIAIAHYDPAINKPVPSSGQTVEGTIRLEVAFSDVANVLIKVDPAMLVALQRLTRLPWIPIISMSLTAPPASPVPGDTYVVAASPTGSWAGHVGKIAEYTLAGWAIIAPPNGHGVSLPDGRIFERIAGVYVEKIAADVQSGKWLYEAAGGTANALTLALVPALTAYQDGTVVKAKASTANTGAATLKVNDLAAVPLVNLDGSALAPSTLRPNDPFTAIYLAGSFFITSTGGAASQPEADAGVVSSRFLTPASQKKGIRFFDAQVTAAQSVPSGTMTTLAIGAAAENGLIDTTTFSTSKLTIGARDAGVWMVMAYVQYTGANGNKSLRIHRNGASTSYAPASRIGISQNGIGQDNDCYTLTTIMRLVEGDQVSAEVLHAMGTTVTTVMGRFFAVRLGS